MTSPAPLLVNMDKADVEAIHCATAYAQGVFSPANLIKLAANRGHERTVTERSPHSTGDHRMLYNVDERKPITPWSENRQQFHAL